MVNLSPIELAILKSLSNNEGTAMDVMERGRWSPLTYGRLRDLESAGYVTHRETEPIPERGNRPRYFYSLTDAGRAALGGG